MRNVYLVLGCLISASFFIACQSGEDSQSSELNAEDKKALEENVWEPEELYEATELALLMRKMWEENMELKQKVANGGQVDSFPKSYYTIHTAKATNPDEINEIYHSFADMYLNSLDELADPSKEGKTIAFNNMVKTCVACHKEYCQGPIPKIKKLYIR